MFLLDLHTDFSGGRSGGLVFPSPEEFSSLLWSTVKVISIVNEADVFLEFSRFFCDPADVGNMISGSSASSKSSLNIQKFTIHLLLKPAAAAAAAAKSLQSCLTLCSPIDSSSPGSPTPGILQARTPEWVAISFSNAWKWKVKVKSLSRVQLFVTPWTAAHQAPLSMGFSRQEYWRRVPWRILSITLQACNMSAVVQ